MNWRTGDDQSRNKSRVGAAPDAGVTDLRPLAGPERSPVARSRAADFRLGATLLGELQTTRHTRGRFDSSLYSRGLAGLTLDAARKKTIL
jgi:hypothetical protein